MESHSPAAESLPTTSRLLLFAGLLTWAMIAVPYLVAAFEQPQYRTSKWYVWLAAHLLFAGFQFLCFRKHPDREQTTTEARHHRLLLALQTLTALVAVAAIGDGLVMILLVVVAAQVPFSNSLRTSIAWICVQTAIAAPLAMRDQGMGRAVVETGTQLGFQLFAVYASTTAVRERQSRSILTELNAELLSTRELLADSSRLAERRRISRELHDLMGHHLTALSLQLEVAGHKAEGELEDQIRAAQNVAAELLEDVRQVVRTFRTENSVNLAAPLRTLVQAIPRPTVHLDLPDSLEIDDPVRANAILRSVQEVVTNAARHSRAENLWIELNRSANGLTLDARDDGRGTHQLQIGNGLTGLRERLEELGGTLELETASGQGFRVSAHLPLQEPSA